MLEEKAQVLSSWSWSSTCWNMFSLALCHPVSVRVGWNFLYQKKCKKKKKISSWYIDWKVYKRKGKEKRNSVPEITMCDWFCLCLAYLWVILILQKWKLIDVRKNKLCATLIKFVFKNEQVKGVNIKYKTSLVIWPITNPCDSLIIPQSLETTPGIISNIFMFLKIVSYFSYCYYNDLQKQC